MLFGKVRHLAAALTMQARAGMLLLFVAAPACGDPPAATAGIQGCVQPPRGPRLCYETVGQRQRAIEKYLGSPGVSVRIYGCAQGREVPLFTSSGGPKIPEAWREQPGRPECYAREVDFPEVERLVAAEPIVPSLQRHREQVLAMVETAAHQYLEDAEIQAMSCAGVTADNMIDLVAAQHQLARERVSGAAQTSLAAAASGSGLARAPRGDAMLMRHQLRRDDGRGDAHWAHRWRRCVTVGDAPPICLETAERATAEQQFVASRVTSGYQAEVTLIVEAAGASPPVDWVLDAPDYAQHLDEVDAAELLAQVDALEVAPEDERWAASARHLVHRLVGTLQPEVAEEEGQAWADALDVAERSHASLFPDLFLGSEFIQVQ